MKDHQRTGHEEFCIANADHFTAVRGRGAGRTRRQFPTIGAARGYASGFPGKRTMIYAITAAGNSAHIENA